MPAVEHDHVVEPLPADRPDHALREWILPRTPLGRGHFLHAHRVDLLAELRSVDAVPVGQEMAWSAGVRKRLESLLRRPQAFGFAVTLKCTTRRR